MVPTKRGVTLVGIAYKPCWMVDNCVTNMLNALETRHLAAYAFPVKSLPNPPYMYTTLVAQELKSLYAHHFTVGAWRKGKTLIKQGQIEDSVAHDPLAIHWVKSHIKTETVAKRPTKARVIQAFLHLRDNYEFADEYRAFTEAFTEFTSIPRVYFGTRVHLRSACGLAHNQIAAQITEWVAQHPRARMFMDDVSNMDGSVQAAHLEPHYDLYEQIDANLAWHARKSFRFKGLMVSRDQESTIVYSGTATVKSGAQDTSSGQTTRRADSFVRCLYGTGVTAIVGFVFGDDLWVLLEGSVPHPDEMYRLQSLCGWKTKGCYVNSIEETDFLACAFVPDVVGGYAMVPQPGRLLAKLFWTHRRIPPRRLTSYRKQVAEAFLPRYRGFRFMEAWLAHHMKGVVDLRCRLDFEHKIQPAHPHPLDWRTFLFRRYGLGLPPEVEVKALHRMPEGQTALVYSEWVNAVMMHDLADPAERFT